MNENENITKTQLTVNESMEVVNIQPTNRLNRTMKKKLKYEQKLEFYKKKKIEKKQLKKTEKNQEINKDDLTHKERKTHKHSRLVRQNIIDKLKNIYENNQVKSDSLKISIDCSFCSLMSAKEQSRFAQQIGRCYASNRAAEKPAYFKLINIKANEFFYKELCRVNAGFERYVLELTDQTLEAEYSSCLNELVYLTPDSQNVLKDIDLNKIYIIGGLVDETVNKKVTLSKCEGLKLNTVRLPIEDFMSRHIDPSKYNHSKILSVNQVFDILLEYVRSKNWKTALGLGVPKRKGFFIQEDIRNSQEINKNKVEIELKEKYEKE